MLRPSLSSGTGTLWGTELGTKDPPSSLEGKGRDQGWRWGGTVAAVAWTQPEGMMLPRGMALSTLGGAEVSKFKTPRPGHRWPYSAGFYCPHCAKEGSLAVGVG